MISLIIFEPILVWSDNNEESFQKCEVGYYGKSYGLMSWAGPIEKLESGKCFFKFSWEMEGGYIRYSCEVPLDELEPTDWDEITIPIEHDAIQEFCDVVKSGNSLIELEQQRKQIRMFETLGELLPSIIIIPLITAFIILSARKMIKKKHT